MAASFSLGNKKYRRLATSALTLVVLAGLQPLVWGFVHHQALAVQQQRSQGQQIANVNSRNEEITTRLRTASEFLNQLDVVSPPTTAKTQVVERTEQLADQLGLPITITVIQEVSANGVVAENDPIVPVSLSVSVTGSIPQVLGFLDRLERTHELALVHSWTLQPAPAGPQYVLKADIYFFLRPPASS